jgi:methylmalonyl-CoA/ethylmalonyl-CoA epimerase
VRLHHIGVVVRSVGESGAVYAEQLGMRALGPAVHDPLQRVIVQFWAQEGNSISIELIEPVGDDSPVAVLLSKGGGLAHLCYEVDDLDGTLKDVRQKGGIVISGPVPATAFHERRIAFVILRGIGVTEFVEKSSS